MQGMYKCPYPAKAGKDTNMDEKLKETLLQMIDSYQSKNKELDEETSRFLMQMVSVIQYDSGKYDEVNKAYDAYVSEDPEHSLSFQEFGKTWDAGHLKDQSQEGLQEQENDEIKETNMEQEDDRQYEAEQAAVEAAEKRREEEERIRKEAVKAVAGVTAWMIADRFILVERSEQGFHFSLYDDNYNMLYDGDSETAGLSAGQIAENVAQSLRMPAAHTSGGSPSGLRDEYLKIYQKGSVREGDRLQQIDATEFQNQIRKADGGLLLSDAVERNGEYLFEFTGHGREKTFAGDGRLVAQHRLNKLTDREIENSKDGMYRIPYGDGDQLKPITQEEYDQIKEQGFKKGCLDYCDLEEVVLDSLPEYFAIRSSRLNGCQITGKTDALAFQSCILAYTIFSQFHADRLKIEDCFAHHIRTKECSADKLSFRNSEINDSEIENCPVSIMDMTNTKLDKAYFYGTRPRQLIGSDSMSMTIGGGTYTEVKNYKQLIRETLTPENEMKQKDDRAKNAAKL